MSKKIDFDQFKEKKYPKYKNKITKQETPAECARRAKSTRDIMQDRLSGFFNELDVETKCEILNVYRKARGSAHTLTLRAEKRRAWDIYDIAILQACTGENLLMQLYYSL